MRQQQGRFEVDLLAELAGGQLIGLEIKADAAPTADSARHLAALRDRYPDPFVTVIVLHTGPRACRLGSAARGPHLDVVGLTDQWALGTHHI